MTITTTPDAAELRRALADKLLADGAIRSPEWHAAFAAVTREVFVPSFQIRTADGMTAYDRDHPDWLATVYSDDSLLTQISDGGVATSSSTLPTLMALMLEALDVQDGHRVLEIATGTGYNAALLSQRLGDGNVVTIEVDPDLSQAAAQHLDAAGYRPLVLAGDGRSGHPDGGPFDRLIATCGFESIPAAWLEQVRPGGVIVCPLGGGIVRLTVGTDGTAAGRFLPDAAYFMPVRDLAASPARGFPAAPDACTSRPSRLDPSALLDDGVHFLLTLALPGVVQRFVHGNDGAARTAQMWGDDGSWAELQNGVARQAGSRQLLDLAEAAVTVHEAHGQPVRERYGLTVTPDRQWAWLDSPDGPGWKLA